MDIVYVYIPTKPNESGISGFTRKPYSDLTEKELAFYMLTFKLDHTKPEDKAKAKQALTDLYK